MDSKYNIKLNKIVPKFPAKRPNANSPNVSSKKIKIKHKNKGGNQTPAAPRKIVTPKSLLEQRKRLPVYGVRGRLLDEIRKNDTLIIIGETGSGKTTQIPQLIHEARLEQQGVVGVTQPRRVAAITIAMRVAQEMNTALGEIVGYTVRFEDMTSHKTKVKYMTDGMLLREAMMDPLLMTYSVLVLDEAHERTVSTDVLFGIIKQAQRDRKMKNAMPLKVIVMSATMDVDVFSSYLNKCPVIYLEGRTFPVTIYHMKSKNTDYQHSALCTVFQIHKEAPIEHDVLVFLTGQEEIETLTYNIRQIAKEMGGGAIKVCPLFAGLSPHHQLEAWKPTPDNVRKVILATNIAETSITIPNIKCVVDTGVVKARRYCAATGAELLRVEPCSQAACWQRAGRAGRDSPGSCYRLFPAAHLALLPAYTPPDILRCPLAPVLLQILSLGIDPVGFDLIDKPPEDALQGAMHLLKQLGAVTGNDSPTLTPLGKKMAVFPVDPKFSKVLLNSQEFNCLEEVLSIVAVLSSDGIFFCPVSKREEALKAKAKFISPLGDHMTLLNVYKAFCTAPQQQQWCRNNFMNHRNLTYAKNVRQQLADLCQKYKLNQTSCGTETHQVMKCMISGLFVNTAWVRSGALLGNNGRYMTASGLGASIHPSSVLHGQSPAPRCLLYTELVTTQRNYLSAVSAIEPEWLYDVVPDFARKCRINH